MTEWIHCSLCKENFEVSEEDPDSTLSDAFDHLDRRHPGADGDDIVSGKARVV